MSRHGFVEHVPQHRLIGRPKRCRCGCSLPCTIQASIDRQQYLNPEAAPAWNDRTMQVPVVPLRPAAPKPPLMTLGQQQRSHQGRLR